MNTKKKIAATFVLNSLTALSFFWTVFTDGTLAENPWIFLTLAYFCTKIELSKEMTEKTFFKVADFCSTLLIAYLAVVTLWFENALSEFGVIAIVVSVLLGFFVMLLQPSENEKTYESRSY